MYSLIHYLTQMMKLECVCVVLALHFSGGIFNYFNELVNDIDELNAQVNYEGALLVMIF